MSGENALQLAPEWYEEMKVDGVRVRTFYGSEAEPEVTEKEALVYVMHGRNRYPGMTLDQINLLVVEDEIELTYKLEPAGFDRIPRVRVSGNESDRLEGL